MKQRANPKLIGGFVAGAVVLAVIVSFVFGSGKYFVEKRTYVIYFQSSVSGLSTGDPVKVKGITIGSVRKVKPLFSSEGEFFAEIFIEVLGEAIRDLSYSPESTTQDEIMAELFDRGLRAQLGVASLITGKQYVSVDLYPGTEAVFMGFNDDYIEIPSVRKGIIDTIQDLDIMGLVESTKSMLASIDSLASMHELRTAVTQLNHLLTTVDTLLASLNTEIPEISANLRETSSAISLTAERAEVLLGRIDNIATDGEMEFRRTMNEFEKTARAIRMLAQQIEQHPSSVILGKDK